MPYATLWWDDDKDHINDNGVIETRINFNSAQDIPLDSNPLWIQDSDVSDQPVTPKARYLILESSVEVTDRALEYAILGTTFAPFVTTWKTDNPGSASNQLTIPTMGSGYDYWVDWEDVNDFANSGTAGPFTGDATLNVPSAGPIACELWEHFLTSISTMKETKKNF